ncbi:MAG: hypothetical protein IPI28_17825 [Candidatus Omnitrophica bacterium]|nr:hypothetical protein [Candidatus Omnitrophota bacterium]
MSVSTKTAGISPFQLAVSCFRHSFRRPEIEKHQLHLSFPIPLFDQSRNFQQCTFCAGTPRMTKNFDFHSLPLLSSTTHLTATSIEGAVP